MLHAARTLRADRQPVVRDVAPGPPAGTGSQRGVERPVDDRPTPARGRPELPPLDHRFMALALAEARRARDLDEVPVGAIVVLDGEVVGRGHNRTRRDLDPTAHAEVQALRDAARRVGAARLPGATLYTTVEPCFMCAGAALHARVGRVVWGVRDPKFGGCASLGRVLDDRRANHRAEVTEGVLEGEARELMQEFFRSKR